MQTLGVVAAFVVVFLCSYVTFGAIKALFGLRVTPEEEDEGLDLAEHGMYGYPEQSIPASGLSLGLSAGVPHPGGDGGDALEQRGTGTPVA